MATTLEKPAQRTSKVTALRSMTGFAAETVECAGCAINVTLRSVNHRHLDLRVHLPELLLPLETKFRGLLQSKGARGHVDLKVVVDSNAAGNVAIDEALIAKYAEVFQRIAGQQGIAANLDVASLAQLPGVVRSQGVALVLTTELEAALLKSVGNVVESWDAMRAAEAAALATDLQNRLAHISELVARIERWYRESLPKAQTRLADRLTALVGEAGLEPSRLAQEAILLADRADISEETLRLKSHIAQFSGILSDGSDAGRKLDFLLQEMNREANTILSKVPALGESSLSVTQAGLDTKAEIEKIREQVQNLQ